MSERVVRPSEDWPWGIATPTEQYLWAIAWRDRAKEVERLAVVVEKAFKNFHDINYDSLDTDEYSPLLEAMLGLRELLEQIPKEAKQ